MRSVGRSRRTDMRFEPWPAILGMLVCALLLGGTVAAQWNLQWSQSEYGGFVNYHDEKPSIQPATDGGLLVKTGTIGPTTERDILLLKYDVSGTLLWSFTWNGASNGNDQAYGMVQDAAGNILVAGSTQVGPVDEDLVLIKLDPNGELLWIATLNGAVPGEDRAATLVVDEDGNIYLAGWLATIDSGTGTMIVVKYSSSGDLEWQLPLGDPVHWLWVMPTAMRVIDGNCRVLFGYLGVSANRYRNLLLSPSGEILSDGNGQCAWGSSAASYALDAEGNGYMGGQGLCRFTVYKCGSNGEFQWAFLEPTNLPSNVYGDEVTHIVIGDDGSVYATGRHYGPDYGGPTYSNMDMLTIKLDSVGNMVWSDRYDNQGFNSGEIGYGLQVTPSGHVLVSGYSGEPLPSENLDYLARLISPEGEPTALVTFDGFGGKDCAWSITGSEGQMCLTGLAVDQSGAAYTITQCYWLTTSLGPVVENGHAMHASPNPFNGTTLLEFHRTLPLGSLLTIHDTKGLLVGQFAVGGRKEFLLSDRALPCKGVYALRLVTDGFPNGVLRIVYCE